MPYRGAFDGFHAVSASVSKTCLVRFDNTSTRSRPLPSAVPLTCTPTPIVSSSSRTVAWSATTSVASGTIRSPTIPGIMCQCWRASPEHSGRRAFQGLAFAVTDREGAQEAHWQCRR
jgi:hypothetical protein